MAQVGDQVAQHFIGASRIAAGEILRAGQRVVEEVRLDLCMQQAQLGDGELLLGHGLLCGGLFVAAVFGDAAGDGTGDGFGILKVGAVVDLEPVTPRAALGLAHQGHAADAIAGRDRGEDLVALDVDPVERIELSRRLVAVGIEAGDLGAYLQAVACAFDFFRTWQLADGRIDQVEGFARLQRDFHLPGMAVGQRAAIDATGDQADATDVRNRPGDHEAQRDHVQQEEQAFGRVAVEGPVPDHHEKQEPDGPGDGKAEHEEEAGFHGRFQRS